MASANFPHQLRSPVLPSSIITAPTLNFHLASGEQALRLLLRSYRQKSPQLEVAMPAFVCEAVPRAALEEGLRPYWLDLQNDGSFWSDYHINDSDAARLLAV